MQNKFHFAITGQTAAELIVKRADAFKPNMGLVHLRENGFTKRDAKIAKNYMQEMELKRLELLVERFLSFAELQSLEKRPMYMSDWRKKLGDFIKLNDKPVLNNAGTVSHKQMEAHVDEAYERYNETKRQQIGEVSAKRLTKGHAAGKEKSKGKPRKLTMPPPPDEED